MIAVVDPEANYDDAFFVAMKKPDWDKRIRRAAELAERYSGAAEVLTFYQQILAFQEQIYDDMSLQPALAVGREASFRARLDTATAMKWLPGLLSLVQKKGPAKLALEASALNQGPSERQQRLLNRFLQVADIGNADTSSFFARVLFQPCAEYLAASYAERIAGVAGSVCPVCDAKPQVAVLRPEGDGGKRFLVCSFCLTEWEFRRILCPICGEEDHARLPRYSAEDLLAVRVEACDTCHYYLKSVDMTTDGLAVPVVDEVATVPLDVWAADRGYKKTSLNLMGF